MAGNSPSSPTFHRRARPPPSIRSPSRASPVRCVTRSRATGSAQRPASPAASSSRRRRRRQGRQMFGPYEVEPGPRSVMRSATGLQPTASTHIQRSEVCATCHTLYTHALNASGEATSEFPEQMPYQEWLHSEFRDSQSCQSCHMPVVTEPMPIASVVGQPREGVSRHDFRGANFLMLGILNRFRAELGVVARPAELDAAVLRTKAFLQSSSASVAVESARIVRRPAGSRRCCAQPGGTQAANRVSVPTELAACDRARRRGTPRVLVRRR